MLAAELGAAGFDVLLAEDGRTALSVVRKHVPDVLITDVMMPALDGVEVCRTLKADSRTADIPVLLLSAFAQSPSKVKGFDAGASDYITKPFVMEELIARVQSLLRHKQRIDELKAEVRRLRDQLPRFGPKVV